MGSKITVDERKLLTKAEFARLAGVKGATIALATRPTGLLFKAGVGRGPRMKINPEHPIAQAYLEKQVEEKNKGVKKVIGLRARDEARKQEDPVKKGEANVPSEMEAFADMTIREVVKRFGTDYRMVDYLRALKEIETIEATRVKNARAKGELVHRDLVTRGILDPIDTCYRKMLSDGAKTIARRSVALVGSGADADELEKFVAEQLSSFIRPTKAQIKRALEHVGD